MGKIFDFEPEWKRRIKLYYKFLNIVLSRKIYEILSYQNRMPWIVTYIMANFYVFLHNVLTFVHLYLIIIFVIDIYYIHLGGFKNDTNL